MAEYVFELSEHTDTTVFYGVNNRNLQPGERPLPRCQNHGTRPRGQGDRQRGGHGQGGRCLAQLEQFALQHNTLTEDHIIDLLKHGSQPAGMAVEHLILHGVNGKSIQARTDNQRRLVKEFEENDLLFAIGPAGSGKTYTAIALAVRSLKNKEVKRIILSRPPWRPARSSASCPAT